MTLDEKECIDCLRNPSTPENDLHGWIDCAGTLLLVEAVPELLKVLTNGQYSLPTRQHAARTIRLLGSAYASAEISKLRRGAESEVNNLLNIVENQ